MTTFWLEFLDFAQNDMRRNNALRDVSVMPSPKHVILRKPPADDASAHMGE